MSSNAFFSPQHQDRRYSPAAAMPGRGQPARSALLQHQGGKTRGEGTSDRLRLSVQGIGSSSTASCLGKLMPGARTALLDKTPLKRVCLRQKEYIILTFQCWLFRSFKRLQQTEITGTNRQKAGLVDKNGTTNPFNKQIADIPSLQEQIHITRVRSFSPVAPNTPAISEAQKLFACHTFMSFDFVWGLMIGLAMN